jgi:hypothetical protein
MSNLSPLPSKLEMQFKARAATADRAIAATRQQIPSTANVYQNQRAVEAAQLSDYRARLQAVDRRVAETRQQIPNPADVLQRQRAVEAIQLREFADRGRAADEAIRASQLKQRPFDAQPLPAKQLPTGINQNDRYRPTTRARDESFSPERQNRSRPTTMPTSSIQPRASYQPGIPISMLDAFNRQTEIDRQNSSSQTIETNAENLGLTPQQYKDLPRNERIRRLEEWQKNDWENKSPFNPFGKAWDWAPWNKRDTPNSLNPDKRRDSGFDDQGEIPLEPQLTIAVPFTARALAKVKRYDRGEIYQEYETSYESSHVGIPIAFKRSHPASYPNYYTLVIMYKDQSGVTKEGTLISLYEADEERISPSGDTHANIRPRIIAANPIQPVSRLSDDPIVPPEWELHIFPPLPQRQIEPPASPEYPKFPQPDPYPQPAPQRQPRTAPQPAPAPRPGPTPQPDPIPKPTPDPTAPPTQEPSPTPNPDGIPRPYPSPNPSPNPAPAPAAKPVAPPIYDYKPYPAPTPQSENQKLKFKEPEIIGQQQQQQQQQKQDQYNPNPGPQTPPAKPAPDFDACKDPCIGDMHNRSKQTEPIEITYSAFKGCNKDNGEPEFEDKKITVPTNQKDSIKETLESMAKIQAQECKKQSGEIAIPEAWAVRVGADRPQLVVTYAEIYGTGKLGKSRWSLTIPHYSKPEKAKVQAPKYRRGSWRGTLTLTDGSIIVVNAASSTECKKTLNRLKILVPNEYRTRNGKAIQPKILDNPDTTIRECNVVPVMAKFFKTGQRDLTPTWATSLR